MASKKRKGLSLEDKRKVLLSIYHDQKEPFNLKEMEALGSKKGVVSQTIKDVNQSLVDDFLVFSDKIGSANFFWSFPSKTYQDLLARKEAQGNVLVSQKQSVDQLLVQEKLARQERSAAGRAEKLRRLLELRAMEASLDKELENLKHYDPEEIARVRKAVNCNRSACDRWTDNIWVVKSFLTKKKGMSGKEVSCRMIRVMCITFTTHMSHFWPH